MPLRRLAAAGLFVSSLPAVAAAADGHGHAGEAWHAPPDAAARSNPVAADAASLARGQALFGSICADCHGSAGRGDGPGGESLETRPADLTVMGTAHPPGDLAWKIETGRGDMPGFGAALAERDIWDLVNYVRSLAGPAGQGGAHH